MRFGTLALTMAALLAAGCGQDAAEDGNAAAERGMTAEAITANDVTAIDAVTGAAANMAEDVAIEALPASNGAASGERDGQTDRSARPAPRRSGPAEEAAPSPEPAAEADEAASNAQ